MFPTAASVVERPNGREGTRAVFVVAPPEKWREKAEEKRREKSEKINFIGFLIDFFILNCTVILFFLFKLFNFL